MVCGIGINQNHIISCCKFWEMNGNKEEWYKTHKEGSRKTVGGYIWKYYTEGADKNE